MNWQEKVIPFHLHPLGFVDAFQRYGADPFELLESSGIGRATLDNTDSRISYQQFVDLLRTGIRVCHQPGLGLLVARRFDWRHYGLPGMAILASTSLREATYILHRYICLVQPYYIFFKSRPAYFVDNRSKVIIPVLYLISTELGDERLYQFELEYRVGLLLHIMDQFNPGADRQRVDVELAIQRPAHHHLYREILGYRFHFACKTSRFVLPTSVLNSERDNWRKGVRDYLLRYCDSELHRMESTLSFAEKVRALSYENIPRYLSQKQAADKLGLTSRTLARKLQREDTSFMKVLDEVRREVAMYYLDSTRLSVGDIAEIVGFSDSANFRQAFKRWTGRSPYHLRGHLQKGQAPQPSDGLR